MSILSQKFIKFAPLCIPLSRRLETLGAVVYLFTWGLSVLGPGITLYILFCTNYWYITALYFIWIFYDRNIGSEGGRRSEFVRKWPIWRWYCNYFPIRLVKTVDLDPSKNYLFGFHPHGYFSNGLHGNFGCEGTDVSSLFPGIKMSFLTLNFNFLVPLFREIILFSGGCSVARESMNYLLSKRSGGNGVVIIPGGAREALEASPGTNVLYLRKRKGFIKVAIQNGAPLVPVYSFGESDIYSVPKNPKGSLLRNIQEKSIEIFGAFPLYVFGRGIFQYSFGLLPNRKPITAVVGAPIVVEKIQNPTNEYVDSVQENYITALSQLFYEHRDKYCRASSELIIN